MRGEEEKETGSAENERTASEILISSEEEWLGTNKLDKLDENSENHQKYKYIRPRTVFWGVCG